MTLTLTSHSSTILERKAPTITDAGDTESHPPTHPDFLLTCRDQAHSDVGEGQCENTGSLGVVMALTLTSHLQELPKL